MRSKKELIEFLKLAVPAFVIRHILRARAVKVCSLISPAFAAVSNHYGFETYVANAPGHYYNVVITSDGPISVDLSYIQFKLNKICNDATDGADGHEEAGYYEEEKIVGQALKYIAKNPWRAVRIEPYEYSLNALFEPDINEEAAQREIEIFPKAVKSFQRILAGDQKYIDRLVKHGSEFASYFGKELRQAGL